jgi:hypothetical protein
MLLQILTAILPEPMVSSLPHTIGPWLAVLGFGAYHGANPGMGWLFALSLGLQRRSERAIWIALIPIVFGHMASLVVVALLMLASVHFLSLTILQWLTALLLLGFGIYKVFNYYRHPRWVGMNVGLRDLAWWSFLMATAHGAGLMIAPTLLQLASQHSAHASHMQTATGNVALAVTLHTLAMLMVMATVAWVVYKKLGLAILRERWVNFDLLWAIALLVVGILSMLSELEPATIQGGAMQHLNH